MSSAALFVSWTAEWSPGSLSHAKPNAVSGNRFKQAREQRCRQIHSRIKVAPRIGTQPKANCSAELGKAPASSSHSMLHTCLPVSVHVTNSARDLCKTLCVCVLLCVNGTCSVVSRINGDAMVLKGMSSCHCGAPMCLPKLEPAQKQAFDWKTESLLGGSHKGPSSH